MFEQDYVMNEARKFAQLLARLMGLKVDGDYTGFQQEFNAALQTEYDIAAGKLLSLDAQAFAEHINQAAYSTEKLNALAQLLYAYAEPFQQNDNTHLLLKKVLIIFDVLSEKNHFDSFQNVEKRNAIYRYFINE